ncbi:hypothetical protein HMPREF9144_0333 [Prevotella pallens ATCC 700821]|uniref:Uncharacterized protein n=1 Tax=Prevotella pallens ATCC 700821 TaxID=997353 RepID=F9DF93_9BACT|nr:hypothetical protein HMPREF9144_0333 [Prevotella pallens ATCC 700821]
MCTYSYLDTPVLIHKKHYSNTVKQANNILLRALKELLSRFRN